MIDHCYQYAAAAKQAGRPVVGILCEYTPRELIMAAGGVPVCLCGGSAQTIPGRRAALARQSLSADQIDLRIPRPAEQPVPGNGRPGGGRNDLRRQEEMYELMAETRPMYVLQLPHKAGDREAYDYWVRELEAFRAFLAQRFATDVSDEKIREAIRLLNREHRLRRQLAELMKADRPPMTGRKLLDAKAAFGPSPTPCNNIEHLESDRREARGERGRGGEGDSASDRRHAGFPARSLLRLTPSAC